MFRRTAALTLLFCLFNTVASAAECSSLRSNNENLPDFIIVEDGKSVIEAINAYLGCEIAQQSTNKPQYTSWRMQMIETVQNQAAGAQKKAEDAWLEADSAVGRVRDLNKSLGTDSDSPEAGQADMENVAFLAQDAQDKLDQALKKLQSAYNSVGLFAQQIREFASNGLMPINRISVQILSQPNGADIFMGEKTAYKTAARATVRTEAISNLRLELAGYKPCHFTDGKFTPSDQTKTEYAMFICQMEAMP